MGNVNYTDGEDTYPGQLQYQFSAEDQGSVAGVGGRVGKSHKSGISKYRVMCQVENKSGTYDLCNYTFCNLLVLSYP